MLNALTSYLQQQAPMMPEQHPADAVPGSQIGATAAVSAASPGKTDTGSDNDPYSPSQRALMVSAVASDFDVRSLAAGDVSDFQSRLQQYGLIGGRDLNAFALINTARAELDDETALDTVAILDEARQQFGERGTAYSERQQINRLHTLIQNLASARMAQ
ncbi:MAG: hypothetical protein COB09_01530 [Thalassobium sp.]|nr:MAG: hypothetical protein COB09_01530 [Thalassobium sp.]